MESGITKYRMYMTKKHQNWTMGEKDALLPYLDGEDDEILEYAIINKDFAIILKNDMTYDIKNTRQEAIDFISYIYRNYSICQNFDDRCYIAREDTSQKFLTSAEAQENGVYDYVHVPRGQYYIAKYGKIFAIGSTEQEMQQKMYEHYRAKYTFAY